jgi:hypothetical protein
VRDGGQLGLAHAETARQRDVQAGERHVEAARRHAEIL